MLMKFGNHKLGDDTCIFNMGTAKDCPSRKLGLCQTINKGINCYAEKAEMCYKEPVIRYRLLQSDNWKSKSAFELLSEFSRKIHQRRKVTSYLRYNESGDFYNQDDISKLSYIARGLQDSHNIITYGYSARSDLNFGECGFLIKGSGWNSPEINGTCTVINKEEPVPEGYIECPGTRKNGCARCNLCKINVPHNIAFRAH